MFDPARRQFFDINPDEARGLEAEDSINSSEYNEETR
jgi:hypothetical protein